MHLQKLKQLVFGGFFIIAILCSILIVIIYRNAISAEKIAAQTQQQFSQLNRHQSLLIDLQQIENGQRGFVITGDTKFLNTYSIGKAALAKDTVNLKTGMSYIPGHALTYDSLQTLISKKLAFTENCIQSRKMYGEDAAETLISKSEGWLLMNQIREKLNHLNQHLLSKIDELDKANRLFAQKRVEQFTVLVLVIVLAFAINFWIYRKGFKLQIEREEKLQILMKHQESVIANKIAELNAVFERTTDAFVSFDNELNYIYVNEKAASLHYSTVAEMVGKNILSYTPHKSSPEFYQSLITALNEKINIHNELRYAVTGQWFENWIYPDETGVSVYYRDISKRKQHEEAINNANQKLESLNNRFELILQGTNDVIWDWDLKTNEVWGNSKYLELIKNKPSNQSNFEYFVERMHPDDARLGIEMMKEYVANKKNVMTSEYRFLNAEENWLTLYNRQLIIYDEDGNAIRIVGAIQDITEQKKIQQQIIHEKEMSDILINSLPGVFYMFNKEGKYIRWNKNIEEITGYTTDEMKDLHPIVFVPEEQREMLAEKIANVFNYGVDSTEAALLTKDKRIIPYYFTGMYIHYNGEDCMMGVGIDISERIKIQEELRELAGHLQIAREEERASMAREIHDELGQQLTGIKMDLSWLNKKLAGTGEDVSVKLKEMIALTDDTMKKVRQFATSLRPSLLDDLGLVAALEWQSDEFQKRFDIKVDFISSHPFMDVPANIATALFRIYQESLTNVLRHAKASQVSSVLSLEASTLTMEISDNGIGFDTDELEQKKTMGITGIRERVLVMNGSFQLQSQKGTGVRLTIKVPLIS